MTCKHFRTLDFLKKVLNKVLLFVLIITTLFNFSFDLLAKNKENNKKIQKNIKKLDNLNNLIINKIILTRNNKNSYLTSDAILNLVPYNEGDKFGSNKTSLAILNLYNLGKPFSFFNQVRISVEILDDSKLNLHIITDEKPELAEIIFKNNKKVSQSDLDSKIKLSDIKALGEVDLNKFNKLVKSIYLDKDFHKAEIKTDLKLNKNKKNILAVNITENKPCLVKKVKFIGNKNISGKELRNNIFTREDWILGGLDKAGKYVPDNLDMDKHFIENIYKSQGFLRAKVDKFEVVQDEKTGHFTVIFYVTEGDLYKINSVKVMGNGIIPDEKLRKYIDIHVGDLYNLKKLRDSIELLKSIWGMRGYIFADVSPAVLPNDKDKTVDLEFYSEVGDKVKLNRVNIVGNKKSRNSMIRRNIFVEEGEVLTSTLMDLSKANVSRLGYFDFRDGVNWKINRISDDEVDLDLVLREVKTGKVGAELSWGGAGGSKTHGLNKNSVNSGLGSSTKVMGYVRDSNLFGEGIALDVNGTWSKSEWGLAGALANPWTLDKPIMTKGEVFFKTRDYGEELKGVASFNERRVGGSVGAGFDMLSSYIGKTRFEYLMFYEDFNYGKDSSGSSTKVTVDNRSADGANLLQNVLDRQFQKGKLVTFENVISQDYRNRSLHPNNGYKLICDIKTGFSADKSSDYGYYRTEVDFVWYAPLIDQDTLVFALHSNFGMAKNFSNKNIPFMELFHVGGPDSVRGFFFGEIGPVIGKNSIGSTKAFSINAELIFPITNDLALKGVLFYDGGTGWGLAGEDKLKALDPDLTFIKHKSFDFRQSIGFGIRMQNPTPLKVDWGYKLDRRTGEAASEVHFSMYREF